MKPPRWPTITWLSRTLLLSALASSAAFAASPPNDPHYQGEGAWGQDFDDQWALKQQRVYADIAPQDTDREIIVAVIDTGLDYTHEDLAAEKIWQNPAEKKNGRDDDGNGYVDDLIGWNFVDNNNNPWDLSGHGTHIAGIIAACTNNGIGIAGANPQARIMSLKVANFTGQARSTAVAAAIYYAVDHGARIINLSLGGELVTTLEAEAAAYAQERDVLMLVAAGNRGMSADQQQGYASLPGVLVVGASDQQGARAGFSNFGNNVALLAPGVDVLSLRAQDTDFIAVSEPLDYPPESAVVGEDKTYYRASGTSFANALASGVASRVLSQRPNLTAGELRKALIQSAADVAPPGVDQLSGYGELDYIAALGAQQGQFVHARLSGADLQLEDAGLWIALLGTAAAADFANAELQLRAAPGSIPEVVEATSKRDKRKRAERKKKERKKKRKKNGADQDEPASPYEWQVISTLTQPVDAQQLGRFAVADLTRRAGGSTQWEVRLAVTDANGNRREAFMSLGLPKPDPALAGVASSE